VVRDDLIILKRALIIKKLIEVTRETSINYGNGNKRFFLCILKPLIYIMYLLKVTYLSCLLFYKIVINSFLELR